MEDVMGLTLLGPVFVAGVPAAFATAREVEWKETVADQIQGVWNKPHIERPCEGDARVCAASAEGGGH